MVQKTVAVYKVQRVQRQDEIGIATKQKTEMADAHCHLDMIKDSELISRSIANGVKTIITNGINFSSSRKAIELSDGRNIFAACGVDPETASRLSEEALEDEMAKTIELIKKNRKRIVAIGEIGLDYTKAKDQQMKAKQQTVFEAMLEIAKLLDLPVSVHSRESLAIVMMTLRKKDMMKVHLHFFEGNVAEAKEAERQGYMISIPPIESSKRRLIAKDISINSLMAESDSPAVGESPAWVEKSIRMIAEMKTMQFEKAAEALTLNTKRFFNINTAPAVMRM
jgi:TatD DNase family protein